MKNGCHIGWLGALAACAASVPSAGVATPSSIRVEGAVVCREQGEVRFERTASFVLVIPEGHAGRAVICNENGYYRFEVTSNAVLDKTLTVLFLGRAGNTQVLKRFIGRENIWNNMLKLPTVHVERSCEDFEQDYLHARAALDSVLSVEGVATIPGSSFGVAGATKRSRRPVGRWVTTIVGGVATTFAFLIPARAVNGSGCCGFATSGDSMSSPSFMDLAFSEYSQTLGFHFLPTRGQTETVFWSASSLAFQEGVYASFHTDFTDYFRGSASISFSNGVGLGFGFYGLFESQDSSFSADLDIGSDRSASDEWVVVVTLRSLLNEQVSLGLSGKVINQNIQQRLFLTNDVSNRNFDFDFSTTVRLNRRVMAGLSVMNILNSQVFSLERVAVPTRSLGLGVSGLFGRVNIGGDFFLRQAANPMMSVGVDYVPFSGAVFRLGVEATSPAYSVGFKYKILSYTFNNGDYADEHHIVGVSLSL